MKNTSLLWFFPSKLSHFEKYDVFIWFFFRWNDLNWKIQCFYGFSSKLSIEKYNIFIIIYSFFFIEMISLWKYEVLKVIPRSFLDSKNTTFLMAFSTKLSRFEKYVVVMVFFIEVISLWKIWRFYMVFFFVEMISIEKYDVFMLFFFSLKWFQLKNTTFLFCFVFFSISIEKYNVSTVFFHRNYHDFKIRRSHDWKMRRFYVFFFFH